MARRHEQCVEVRWGDMDAYGHVNNTAFFRYLECARFAFFEQVCVPVLASAPTIVLAEIRCQFKAELVYPAQIVVRSLVSRLGGSSFDIEADIVRGETVCASSLATMVWVDTQSHRPCPVPQVAREAIERFHAEG